MEIRAATPDDYDDLVALRLRFIAELRGVAVGAFEPAFVAATEGFVADLVSSGRLRSWLAVEGELVVGCVSIVIDDRPPLPEDLRQADGWVINMFVEPEHRSAGLGRALIDAAIAAGPDLELRSLALITTDQGRPLYNDRDFALDSRRLVRRIDPRDAGQAWSSGNTVPAGNRAIER